MVTFMVEFLGGSLEETVGSGGEIVEAKRNPKEDEMELNFMIGEMAEKKKIRMDFLRIDSI